MSIIAVDFDGTVVENRFPFIGDEKNGAIETLKDLQKAGNEIIIWTCRTDTKDIASMMEFFNSHDFKPNYVNENSKNIDFNCYPKIYADYYFDDRSFPAFSGWNDVREKFL